MHRPKRSTSHTGAQTCKHTHTQKHTHKHTHKYTDTDRVKHRGKHSNKDVQKKEKRTKKNPQEETDEFKRVYAQMTHVRSRRRRRLYALKCVRKTEKKKRREIRKIAEKKGEIVEKQIPHTIENLRKNDETFVTNDPEECMKEDNVDEFSKYFSGDIRPKLMLTTSRGMRRCMGQRMTIFLKELVSIIPNIYYYKRKDYPLKDILKYASNHEFTDVLVVKDDPKKKKIDGLYICHLPEGPTSFYKVTNLRLASEMKGTVPSTTHNPEIMLNNFDTRLGHRIARQFAALFPQNAEFTGRRVICFHNQRDFVFFRHYRYVFTSDKKKTRLAEIGPRFTLKLQTLQSGTFDKQNAEYEFVWRPDLQVCRKTFFV